MAVSNVTVLATAATAAASYPSSTGTVQANVPYQVGIGHGSLALVVTVSATSGSPAMSGSLQSTFDGTNFFPLALIPNDTDTVTNTVARITVGTTVYFLSHPEIRKLNQFQLVMSTITTVTFSASLVTLV